MMDRYFPLVHKMQKLGLDDGSAGIDQEQINPQGSRRLEFQSRTTSQEHGMKYRDANCSMPSCQKMKRLLSHANACKLGDNGPCASCKKLIALNCYRTKICQNKKGPVAFYLNAKLKQAQILKNLIVHYSGSINQTSPDSKPSPECSNIKRILKLRMVQDQLVNRCIPTRQKLCSTTVQTKCPMVPAKHPVVQAKHPMEQELQTQRSMGQARWRLKRRLRRMREDIRQASSGSRLTNQVSPAAKPCVSRFSMNNTVMNHPTALIHAQQHMQKRTGQTIPGAPNQMMRTRNVANWDSTNFSLNIQPQSILPDQPMGLVFQSQMIGVNCIPIPVASGSVKLSLGMANSETLASAIVQKSNSQDLQQLTSSFGILELSPEEAASSAFV